MKKLIQFGAGKIGRSFIGQLFSRGGYEVVFIDIDKNLVDLLNREKSYHVIIKDEKGENDLVIRNIKAIHVDNRDEIINEITGSSILASAVGQANLVNVVKLIATGIIKKREMGLDCRTDLIIAENLRNAASYIYNLLIHEINNPDFIDKNIGLIETSIGKMVPIMSRQDTITDQLQVFAEPYNTLILDKKGFRNPIPEIGGLAPKENMKAWVDRKSFIHNLGHASAAYYGFIRQPEIKFLYEMLEEPEILNFTRETMMQSADALIHEYPLEFTKSDLINHIDDLIRRFRNRALGDTVYRIGKDLHRKLGPEDRLIGAIKMAYRHHLPFDRISFVLACGFHFRGADETGKMYHGDIEFYEKYKNSTIDDLMKNICGIDPVKDRKIADLIKHSNYEIESQFNINHKE